MKKIILGAATALALALPSVAAADSATVGLHAGNIDVDGAGDADFYGLNGGWNHDFGNGWNLQADARHDSVDVGVADLGVSSGSVSVGIRNDTYSIYGFAGLTDFVVSGTQVGVGGQYYLNNFVLEASYGHGELDDLNADIDSFEVGATWFFIPDFGVGIEASTGEVELFGTAADSTGYGASAVWRFAGSPVSLQGRYRHDELDTGGGDVEIDTWTLGINLNFGTDTAQEQATRGPSWEGSQNLYERSLVFAF